MEIPRNTETAPTQGAWSAVEGRKAREFVSGRMGMRPETAAAHRTRARIIGKGAAMAMAALSEEKDYKDLSKARRWFLLILVSMGSSLIYGPIYLKMVFYDPLMQALNCTNEQLGLLVSLYGIAAVIFYFPSGIIADKFRVRNLSWIGYTGVAALTIVYMMLPSYNVLMGIFIGYAVFSILIWWGTRYKLVRLICSEEEYSQKIGLSYGIYGAVGLVLSFIQTAIIAAFVDAGVAIQVVLGVCAALIGLCAILSFVFIPKFKGEIKQSAGSAFSLRDVVVALKNPGVWLAALTMFFIYFVYIGATFTTPFMTACLAAPVVVVSIIGTIRSFGASIISAPLFGLFTKYTKTASKAIMIGILGAIACLLLLMFLPRGPEMIVVVAVVVCLLSFVMNGLYGIASGQLADAHVPPQTFGAAVGVVSVIGLMPDAFIHTWFGAIIDQQGVAAFDTIFMIMLGASVLVFVFAWLTLKVGKRNAEKLAADGKAEIAEREAAESDK